MKQIVGGSDLEEYVQTLKSNKLKSIIFAFKREFKTKEPKLDREEWASSLNYEIGNFFGDILSDEQTIEMQMELIDVCCYFRSMLVKEKNEHMCECLESISRKIPDRFDEGMFQGIKDANHYKQHFDTIKAIISPDDFPRCRYISDCVDTMMSQISDKMEENPTSDEHYRELGRHLLKTLQTCKQEKKCKQLEDYLDKYRDIYENEKNPEEVKKNLKLLTAIVCEKDFPRFKTVGNSVETLTYKIFAQTSNDQKLTLDILEDVIEAVGKVGSLESNKDRTKFIKYMATPISNISDKFKGTQNLFKSTAESFLNVWDKSKNPALVKHVLEPLLNKVLIPASGKAPDQTKIWIRLIQACLQKCNRSNVDMAKDILEKRANVIKWQDDTASVKQIFITVSTVEILDHEDSWLMSTIGDFMELFLNQLKKSKLLASVNEDIFTLALACVDRYEDKMEEVASDIVSFINFKASPSYVSAVLKKMDKYLKDDNFDWEEHRIMDVFVSLMNASFEQLKDGKQFPDNKLMVSLMKRIMTEDLYDFGRDTYTQFGIFFINIIGGFIRLHTNGGDLNVMEPAVEELLAVTNNTSEDIASSANSSIMQISQKCPEILKSHMEVLLNMYFENEQSDILSTIEKIYPLNPEPVKKHFQKLFALVTDKDSNTKTAFATFLQAIAKLQPEVFTGEIVDTLFTDYLVEQYAGMTVVMALDNLCNKRPELLVKKVSDLMEYIEKQPMMSHYAKNILIKIALSHKGQQEKIMAYFVKNLKPNGDETMMYSMLDGVKNIGSQNTDLLKKQKSAILTFQKGVTNANIKDMCQALIDAIEGRSLLVLSEDIKENKEDIDNLDARVTDTENDVSTLRQDVDDQQQDIEDIKEDVTKVEERLDDVEQNVEDLEEKVEEIDHKTMTNAPAWSRDVTILLNPEADHDWRLLASRLGYTPEDIRGWATQSDPCMAVLSEWYATHKTREATFAVLQTLKEMNRLDAAAVVEEALKSVQDVVDDEPPEYEKPPPVFLSYQWGHQAEAKLIRKHLEMAGFDCWMDVGQMGGGDKLFAKIDTGIRAAKVVVCCVTEKYAQSPNCNREVNLAVNLGKPIIPLLLEKMNWPPPGSMGPIFSEYLFIRFFQRANEETDDDRIWSKDKFQELLMQLSYNKITPEEEQIKGEYANWWEPPEEVIVVKKKSEKTESAAGSKPEEKESDAPSPELFISYQWGKQKQIKLLYKRLSGMGYNCWMDIYQMGGGDSLYDKIDRGIRGCKVVVSCVTPKYAMSANCRREVSLCDALKKPMIPLLLEDMTWPPPGPMSMVYTQLLYIAFYSSVDLQESWQGDEFDQMLAQIQQHIPDPLTIENKRESGKASEKASKKTSGPAKVESSKPVAAVPPTQVRTPAEKTEAPKPEAPPTPKPEPSTSPTKETRPPSRSDTPSAKKSKSCCLL